jgi:hypothetical protein
MDLPQMSPRVRVTKKFRIAAMADQNGVGYTVNQLLGLCGCIATSATTASPIASAVKIESVELWGAPSTNAVASRVSLTWNAYGETGLPSEVSDTTLTTARPAHVRASPPAQSLASFWHVEPVVSQNLFTYYLPQGGIMDIVVSFQLKDVEVNSAIAGSALSTGSLYHYNPVSTMVIVSLQSFG